MENCSVTGQSGRLGFKTSFNSRSCDLDIDMSKGPSAISQASEAYNRGDCIEGVRLLSAQENELEVRIGELECGHMFFIAYLYASVNDYEKAEKWYERAALFNPVDYRFWGAMASFYFQSGKSEKGFDIFRQKQDEVEGKINFLSLRLLNCHYDHRLSREDLFEMHKGWGELVSEEIKPRDASFALKRSGKIRVGYVSPDFKKHSVVFFLMPLLRYRNRDEFEVFGYGSVLRPDEITKQVSGIFDVYHDIYKSNDDELAEQIIEDKIDILVDLAGHTHGSRLNMFAQRPAPIQVTYLGYPNTTGLKVMDYRLTDSIAESEGCEEYHTEKPVFLPGGFLCYNPYEGVPKVGGLSAKEKGYVTFGSFNSIRKLNPYIIKLWSRILLTVDGSRMLLKIKGGEVEEVREIYLRMFESNGVSRDRIEFSGQLPDMEHFDLYNQVDIALDTYPYHGTTTTCEAMWMGVPVVSLVGEHHMCRVGASLLSKVGLEYFAAKTEDEYVAKASGLAMNVESLAKIRASMRDRMRNSSLCDGAGFTGSVEVAYRQMVSDWNKKITNY